MRVVPGTSPAVLVLMRAAAAGALATVPMTAWMEACFRLLPPGEQYPLPPREITDEVRERIDLPSPTETDARSAALLAHFAFGAGAGSLLAFVPMSSRSRAIVTGLAYGTVVWCTAYMGLLPRLELLNPATMHPRGRTALMLSAHWVWGAVAAALVFHMNRRSERVSHCAHREVLE